MNQYFLNEVKVLHADPMFAACLEKLFHCPKQDRFLKLLEILNQPFYDLTHSDKQQIIEVFFSQPELKENRYLYMEYLNVQGNTCLLKDFIKIEMNSSCNRARSWALVYELVVKANNGELSKSALSNKVISFEPNSKDMHLLLCILNMLSVFQIGEYEAFFKVSNAILPEINYIEDSFIKQSYHLRLLELYSYSHLLANKVEPCRDIIHMILQLGDAKMYPIAYINSYHVLAHTFLFTSYETCIENLQKAYRITTLLPEERRAQKQKELHNTEQFVRSFWKRDLEPLPDDDAELAHRYIAMGEMEQAISILDQLRQQQGFFTPFQWYYYGLATNNKDHFIKARKEFESNGDKFFVKILDLVYSSI
ncbi:AimR family lysis-lysogeny pheromone receptor [Bacillus salitolerans]|uniref:AimR family lysis-lysogeny pheromone receptor n=1 Tax=Bacillus salitolerans TaxID=1437434 RepID=A0ABW4LPA3_9BACI